ncbi:MAG: tyrosine-type recombinase/integrase [Gammaproteobacteria bacterium]
MGRRRKHRRDLPQRVYFDHGSYFFVPGKGGKVNLGREFVQAMARWAEIVGRPAHINTMSEIMDRYMREVAPLKSACTFRYNVEEIRNLRKVFGHMRPEDIMPPHIYAYMDERKAPVRANREKALLSHVFQYAIRWGVAKENPCRQVSRNPEKPRNRYVTDDELDLFLSVCPPFLQAYVGLKRLTGLRCGDMLSIKLSDLIDEGLIVTQNKTGTRLLYGWARELRAAVDVVTRLPRPVRGMHLFCTRRGQPYTPTGFRSIWQRAMAKAVATGLERFTEHDLRAKVITDARELGQDAQRIAGHKSSAMTDRYVKVRTVERVDPLRPKGEKNIPQTAEYSAGDDRDLS